MAKSTWSSYSRGVESFHNFRSQVGFDNHWPAPVDHVVAFIAHLSLSGKAASTISSYSAALAYYHKINGWADPTDNFIVRKLKEGCRRQGDHADVRRPVTVPLLSRMVSALQSVCSSSFEVSLFKAAFVTAFFGFLRVGEFTAASKAADTTRILALGDTWFEGEDLSGMVIRIRFSKTDQQGVSVSLRFHARDDPFLCPVASTLDYVRRRPPGDGPLFIHFDKTPLTTFQFSQVMKKCLSIMGIPPDEFSSHSFRIGAATSAAISGVPVSVIKEMGRWKSAAFQLYIRPQKIIIPAIWQ